MQFCKAGSWSDIGGCDWVNYVFGVLLIYSSMLCDTMAAVTVDDVWSQVLRVMVSFRASMGCSWVPHACFMAHIVWLCLPSALDGSRTTAGCGCWLEDAFTAVIEGAALHAGNQVCVILIMSAPC